MRVRVADLGRGLLTAAAAVLLLATAASAQVAIVDPQTGEAVEASAATTVMLDATYLARIAVEEDVEIVPLSGPGRGFVSSNPGAMTNYMFARTGNDGSLVTECMSAAEFTERNARADGREGVAR